VSNAEIGDEIQLGDEIPVVEDHCSSNEEEKLSENPNLSVTIQNDLFGPDQSAKNPESTSDHQTSGCTATKLKFGIVSPKPLPVFPILPILQPVVPQNQPPDPVLISPRPTGHRVVWRTVKNRQFAWNCVVLRQLYD